MLLINGMFTDIIEDMLVTGLIAINEAGEEEDRLTVYSLINH